jgi:hypothetical protein
MASKKKAAAGAFAAGQAARENPYVRRLMEDPELREELRSAFDSARKAYNRIDGKGPAKAFEDKKLQREGGLGRVLLLAIVGGAIAMVVSEDARKKVLDTLFGAEEEYEYTGTTTPSPAAAPTETANAS